MRQLFVLITTASLSGQNCEEPICNRGTNGERVSSTGQPDGYTLAVALATANLGLAVSAMVGAASVAKTTFELSRGRRVQAAERALEYVDRIKNDPKAIQAMRMLDWTGREYEIAPGEFDVIWFEDLGPALVDHHANPGFDHKQAHIRDCFDAFFDRLDEAQHAVEVKVIRQGDLRPGLSYWARRSASFPSVFSFAKTYEHTGVELLESILEPPAPWFRRSRN
jgi:hypothetical protein